MAYVVELLMERYFADIHSSAHSILGYFPNIWLYYSTMPGAHFNTIKQDCRKILNFWGTMTIGREGFVVIMAKNLGDNGLPGIALSVSIFLVIVVVLLQSFTYFYLIFYENQL